MRKERKEIIFPYHIVTPVLLVVLLLWPQLKALYAWWQRFSWSMIPMVPISLSVLGFVFVFIGLQVYYHVRTRKEWRTVQVIPSNQVTVTHH